MTTDEFVRAAILGAAFGILPMIRNWLSPKWDAMWALLSRKIAEQRARYCRARGKP